MRLSVALTQLSRRSAVTVLFLGLSVFLLGRKRGARHDGGWRNSPCGTIPVGESTLLQSLCKEQGNVIFQMRASLLQRWTHLLCFPSLLPSQTAQQQSKMLLSQLWFTRFLPCLLSWANLCVSFRLKSKNSRTDFLAQFPTN